MSDALFHILEDNTKLSVSEALCHLSEQLYMENQRVLIWCNDYQQCCEIDELLWQFKEESFVPHNIEGEGPMPLPPVHICHQKMPSGNYPYLLILADQLPDGLNRFKHIWMVVGHDESQKAKLREHYIQLKSQGHAVRHQSFEPQTAQHTLE